MYYLLILIILLLYNQLQRQPLKLKVKKENIYSWFICIILVLLAAFRSDEVGADTPGYRYDYELLGLYPTFQSLIDRYSINYIGYFGLSKLFYLAHMPVQVWFGFVEAFYLYALMKLINNYSKDKLFSLLVFTTIGLYTFSLAGLKQTFASSLMMLAFLHFTEKRYWLSTLLIFIVYYTHQSALIFLGAFPMYYFRNTKWLVHMSVLACIWIYFNSYFFMTQMVDLTGNEKWQQYLVQEAGYTYVTFIFYFVITAISAYYIKNYNKKERGDAHLALALSIIGCGLQLLAGVSPSLFRLAYLYTPFLMILLPNTTYYAKDKTILRFILMGSIIFYFLYTGRNSSYSFI